jgi:hypothetical protein
MGVKVSRKKSKNLLVAFVYRLQKMLPISRETKLKWFLNLEWVFNRLSNETANKIYSPAEHPGRVAFRKFILDSIKETDTVLDLGCNRGDRSSIVAEKAKEVIGIDFDEPVIARARALYERENLKFYNGEALKFMQENKRSFDVLILSHILEHLDEPKNFLTDFKNYFKRIYIEVPDFDWTYLNHYRRDFNVSLIYSDQDHISEFDRDELKSLLHECNIEIIKEEFKFGVQRYWCKVN